VILMPETGAGAALTRAVKLLDSLMTTSLQMKNGFELNVRASVGLATAPADGATVHAIIGAADMRMYLVKSNGRGKVWGA
jgi:diguanylate cyclase (GGDEF)-like protein